MEKMSIINFNHVKDYKRWSYSDFAREFDISPQGARVYFVDRQAPVELAIKMAEMMNISLDYIYRYELTEDILRKNDPYYITEKAIKSTNEPSEDYKKQELTKEQRREVMAMTAKDPFKAAMKLLLQEIMEEKEKENKSSKAS